MKAVFVVKYVSSACRFEQTNNKSYPPPPPEKKESKHCIILGIFLPLARRTTRKQGLHVVYVLRTARVYRLFNARVNHALKNTANQEALRPLVLLYPGNLLGVQRGLQAFPPKAGSTRQVFFFFTRLGRE